MNTYLFTWNPKRWTWADLEETVLKVSTDGRTIVRWSCGNTRKMKPGDRGFLMKLGTEEPKGIMGSGTVTSYPYKDQHYNRPNEEAYYVEAEYDVLLNPYKDPILSLDELRRGDLSQQKWTPEGSGISVKLDVCDTLEKTWFRFLQTGQFRTNPLLPSAPKPNQFLEGDSFEVRMTRYERNPFARSECIRHYGLSCVVCGFNFEKIYGSLGKDFIHVHHLNQIAHAGGQYLIDPINDLRPVCPNCHAMLHRGKTLAPVDELRTLLNSPQVNG